MSAFVNDRDALIQATVPRYSVPLDRALILSASATLFEVSAAGVPTPATITFSALLLGAAAEIVFATEPQVHLTVANGDAVLKFEDMTSSIVTVTAYAVVEGLTYLARQTVSKQQLLDLTPPPAPTGLAASGTSTTIALHWNAAPGNYNNLSHTEVWRAPVNDFAQAVLAGRADGREYIDAVGPGATRYYWIRYISRAAIPGPYNASSGTVGASSIEVEHLLEVLTGELREQQLYADLGARIDLIDAPDTLPGSVAARIRTERTVREEEDAALSESITQVSAAAGENTAAIEEEALVRATETGELYAQYTIKQDVNGYVSGYGLATTANNAAPTSAFAVRADTFYIASPSGPGVAPSMPFIVRTTETVVDGVTVPIGTYIADAFIQNASITNAKIGGDIWSSNYSPGQAGWYLNRAGDMEINNLRARGHIVGGAFTHWDWPESGTTGFYLGPEGLAIGNERNGRFFLVGVNGDVTAPGFTILDGAATFSGKLQAATGSFVGNVISGLGTGFRVEMGPDDPVYAMWAGSGTKNDTNAIFYLKRSGAGYFGGSLSAGVLKTAVTNPAYDPAAQVVDGPFGSNGGTINVVCSLTWRFDKSSRGHTYTADSGSNAVTIRLYRTIGAGAEELVQSSTFSGSTSIVNSNDPDTQSTCSRTIDGSFTYTDTAASTQNRIYRAVVAISQQSITMTPRPGGGGEDPDALYQRLTIITTE